MDIIRPIEPFELTQGFGGNEPLYRRFGLKGHNGWDIRTKYPDTTQGRRYIFASWLSEFYKKGNEGNDGFGLYFDVIVRLGNSIWKNTYAHCHSIESFKTKNEGESMAISDNTGNSTGAHLHLTCKRVKWVNGQWQVQDYNNGYFGAVNPQEFFDELRILKKQGGGSVANMYPKNSPHALDISNPESMKPIVDLYIKWKLGGLVERSELEKAQVRIKELENKPSGDPKIIQALKDFKSALNSL